MGKLFRVRTQLRDCDQPHIKSMSGQFENLLLGAQHELNEYVIDFISLRSTDV
jgi:hypothetical protein